MALIGQRTISHDLSFCLVPESLLNGETLGHCGRETYLEAQSLCMSADAISPLSLRGDVVPSRSEDLDHCLRNGCEYSIRTECDKEAEGDR